MVDAALVPLDIIIEARNIGVGAFPSRTTYAKVRQARGTYRTDNAVAMLRPIIRGEVHPRAKLASS